MSFIGDSPKLKRTRYKPQSADPVNPIEGDVFYSDGTPRAEGLWLYQNGSWISLASQRLQRVEFADKEFLTARCATTANLILASQVENGDTIDGVVLATGDLVLVKNQTTSSENGLYQVQVSGAPVRATGATTAAQLSRLPVFVQEGTANENTNWWQQNDLVSLTDPQVWKTSGPYGGLYYANCATTANVNIANELENGDVIDGYTLVTGDLVLVKNQSTSSENGVYVVPASGAATRAGFANAASELNKIKVYVGRGNTQSETVWWQTNTLALLTDPQNWEQTSGPASYTWTVPTGVSQVIITGAGGGGGGGAGLNRQPTNEYLSGGGGGAGSIPQDVVLDVQFGDTLTITCGGGGRGGWAKLNNIYGLNGEAGQDTTVVRTGPSGTRTLRFKGAPGGLKGAGGYVTGLRFIGSPGGGRWAIIGYSGSEFFATVANQNQKINISKGGWGGGASTDPSLFTQVDSTEPVPNPFYILGGEVFQMDSGQYYRGTIQSDQTTSNGVDGEDSGYAKGGKGGRTAVPLVSSYAGGGGGGGAGFGDGANGAQASNGVVNAISDAAHAAAGSSAGGGGGAAQCLGGGTLAQTRAGRGGRGGSGKVIITY